MSTRRDPPASAPRPSANDSTALMDRPLFSEGDSEAAEAEGGFVDSFGEAADAADITSPRPAARRPSSDDEAATGRFDLGGLDDIDGLPSAHVSELGLSDLDGDAEDGGAPTAIMQVPPEMLRDRVHTDARTDAHTDSGSSSDDDVDLRKWSAGPPGARHDMPMPASPPPSADMLSPASAAFDLAGLAVAATKPARAQPPMPLPMPPAPVALRADDVSRAPPPGALRAVADEALAAVNSARGAADRGDSDALDRSLTRAEEALGRLLDQLD